MKFNHLRSENELFGLVVFEELSRLGLKQVFIAPGSRSTPLVLGAHAQKQIQKTVHFDERGLGFAALGAAKATQTPVAIITTSGTAVSNLLPAITEAYYSRVPLLIFSADRPFELRETGANQAIDQTKMFQSVVCEQFDVPAPSAQTDYKSIFSMLSNVYLKSQSGPVHINCMFKEPLSPPLSGNVDRDFEFLDRWYGANQPFIKNHKPLKLNVVGLEPLYKTSDKVLIVAGGGLSLDDQSALLKLSEHFQLPLLPDVISGLRFKGQNPNIICHAEMSIEAPLPTPDVLLHFGGPLQSKKINEYCNNLKCKKVWINNEDTRQDYQHQSKLVIKAPPAAVALNILEQHIMPDANFASAFKEINQIAEAFLTKNLLANTLSEPAIARIITLAMPENANLYSGSSRPIRDFERFGSSVDFSFNFFSNRGTSGIDGNLASFFGIAHATQATSFGLIGDLAFLHDVNSLSLLKQVTTPTVLIVVNNKGGGIFSFLPVHEQTEAFETYFAAPHNFDISSVARGFGLNCTVVSTPEELKSELHRAQKVYGLTLLEARTDRNHNLAFHKNLQSQWAETLNP